MEQKRNGFGTRIGFELAAAGSAVGLGNLWGFPYKASANGGAAYLFVYLACIFLVGAIAMLAEFYIGRRSKANPVSAYKAISPGWGWIGLLAVVVPALIMCYYYVLGGYTVKYALNSFVGNAGQFQSFAGNVGDVILHTAVFALIALAIVTAGVRHGIEKAAKLLLPTMLVILIVISSFSLLLGAGVLVTENPFLIFAFAPIVLVNGGGGMVKILLLRFFRKCGLDVRPPSQLQPEEQQKRNVLVKAVWKVRFPLHDHCKKELHWTNAQVLMRFLLLQAFLMPLVFLLLIKIR